jgi:hypothetical protein
MFLISSSRGTMFRAGSDAGTGHYCVHHEISSRAIRKCYPALARSPPIGPESNVNGDIPASGEEVEAVPKPDPPPAMPLAMFLLILATVALAVVVLIEY